MSRAAVFLFNFRSNADVFLVAALVKDNWTGAAPGEARSSRVFGQLGKLLDIAFVDRGHPGTAAALRLAGTRRSSTRVPSTSPCCHPSASRAGPC
jgi:1-acyl-sn-glycerol-3-phosphate acyltransferase